MRDPYQVLGLKRGATADEIKQAYRRLARKLHPDVNPGDKESEAKFKNVTAAYDFLNDTVRRAKYDRGEIDASGNAMAYASQGARSGARRGAAGGDAFNFESRFSGAEVNPEDLFADLFGAARRQGGFGAGAGRDPFAAEGAAAGGGDIVKTLSVSFIEAACGGQRRLTLAGGRTLEVAIPAGTEDGQRLRLRGQGMAHARGKGDLLVEIKIEPHPYFKRQGADIHLDLPVSVPEAMLGASVTAPTLDGKVTLRVPKSSNTGTLLRLKGKGVPKPGGTAGDMYITLRVVLPENPDASFTKFVEGWAKAHAYNPRSKMGME